MSIVPIKDIAGMVGTEVGRSEWLTIDQDRISQFAEATLDRQWIHIDPEAAARGPYGATIAHGFLTLSLLPYLGASSSVAPEGMAMAINYGSDKVRFLNPVVVGSRVRSVTTLKDFTERSPGRYLATNHVVVEIEGEDTPALIADTLTLYVMKEAQ
ncbi:MAG: MaoC family dehydratase [Acidimicrobiia bacterium]|nr:MaoC family dehydratase [Acidimicrobiia bacterium]